MRGRDLRRAGSGLGRLIHSRGHRRRRPFTSGISPGEQSSGVCRRRSCDDTKRIRSPKTNAHSFYVGSSPFGQWKLRGDGQAFARNATRPKADPSPCSFTVESSLACLYFLCPEGLGFGAEEPPDDPPCGAAGCEAGAGCDADSCPCVVVCPAVVVWVEVTVCDWVVCDAVAVCDEVIVCEAVIVCDPVAPCPAAASCDSAPCDAPIGLATAP